MKRSDVADTMVLAAALFAMLYVLFSTIVDAIPDQGVRYESISSVPR